MEKVENKKNIKHLMNIFSVKIKYNEEKFTVESESSEKDVSVAASHIRMMIRNKMIKETTCPICLLDLDNSKNVTTTKCGHNFHSDCLHRSLKTSSSCPLCRTHLLDDGDKLSRNKINEITNRTLTHLTYSGYFYKMVYYMSTESYINCNTVNFVRDMIKEPISYVLNEVNRELS